MRLDLTAREVEALRMALGSYADSYQNEEDLTPAIRQDIKAVSRILGKIDAEQATAEFMTYLGKASK
jgi:hypothetical protein